MSKPITIEQYKNTGNTKVSWVGEDIPKNCQTHTQWKCSCGVIFSASYVSIKHQKTSCKKCGLGKLRKHFQLKLEDYISVDKNNVRWLLCQNIPDNSDSKTLWVCRCGKIFSNTYNKITRRNHTCGCGRLIKGKENKKWIGGKYVSKTRFNSIKAKSVRNNRVLEFTITLEYIDSLLEQQNFKCALTGVNLETHYTSKGNTASLDRIDSKLGYVPGNVQWVHKRVNKMKQDIPEEEFIIWCERIYKFNA